jgi:replicative DNA helicase
MATAKIDTDRIRAAADIVAVVSQFVALKDQGRDHMGLCPFHREKSPSFTVTPEKGMYYCFGCQKGGDVFDFVSEVEGIGTFQETAARVAELVGVDLEGAKVASTASPAARRAPVLVMPPAEAADAKEEQPAGKIVAVYPYTDETGAKLYEVCRVEPGRNGKKKDFRQRTVLPGGGYSWKQSERKVLYRLPAVLAADEVWIVEGEKDVATLEAAGVVATTNSGGAAAKWIPEFSESLRGKRVVLVPDSDDPGRKRADIIAKALSGVAAEVVRLDLPADGGKDVTEWVEAGKTVADLAEMVETARIEKKREVIERRGLLHATEILELCEGGINTFMDPSRRALGIPSGFRRWDQMTLGLHAGELVILAARPAMGKTALALNVAANVASGGKAVAVFSLEMSRESLLARMVCSRARVDQMKYRAGRMDRDESRRAAAALADLCDWRLFIDDAGDTSLKTVRAKLGRLKAASGLDLVVIDYLQLMNAGKGENRTLEVGALSRGLKLMSKEFKVPFLVLSQLSRAPEARTGNHRPQLSDLRESGGIEQDADAVAFIYRPEVYQPDREDLRGVAELILAKQRNGPIGKIPLVWIKEHTRFESPAGTWEASEDE